MQLELAIYEVKQYEVKSPLGPRQVRVHTKSGAIQQEVPDEAANELKGIREINSDLLIEGVGHILVQTQRGIMPQPIGFPFGPEITTYVQAFEQFDKYLEQQIKRLQEEQQKQQIGTASADDLRRIDAAAKRTKTGLITP